MAAGGSHDVLALAGSDFDGQRRSSPPDSINSFLIQ